MNWSIIGSGKYLNLIKNIKYLGCCFININILFSENWTLEKMEVLTSSQCIIKHFYWISCFHNQHSHFVAYKSLCLISHKTAMKNAYRLQIICKTTFRLQWYYLWPTTKWALLQWIRKCSIQCSISYHWSNSRDIKN